MSVDLTPPPWVFIVDTDKYSGNFEREFRAWITGQIDECDIGAAQARATEGDLSNEILQWFSHNLMQVPDEHGTRRPGTIWPTPGFFNDGFGNEWPVDADPEKIRMEYEASVQEHKGIRSPQELQELQELIDRGPGNFPSYQSVAIFFYVKPPENILNLMMKRAKNYCLSGLSRREFKILGFRLISLKLVETVEWEETDA